MTMKTITHINRDGTTYEMQREDTRVKYTIWMILFMLGFFGLMVLNNSPW